jgi:hypothetical protein
VTDIAERRRHGRGHDWAVPTRLTDRDVDRSGAFEIDRGCIGFDPQTFAGGKPELGRLFTPAFAGRSDGLLGVRRQRQNTLGFPRVHAESKARG